MTVSTDPADIAENRQGRLSQAQIAAYDRELRGTRRWGWVVPFVFVTFIAASAILTNSHAPVAIAAFVAVEAAAVLLLLALMRWIARRARSNVLGDGVECSIGRLSQFRRSAYRAHCYVSFGDSRVLGAPLEAIAPIRERLEQHPHRVYFLSRLGTIVALEPE